MPVQALVSGLRKIEADSFKCGLAGTPILLGLAT